MKIKEIAEYMRKNIEKSCTVEGTAREFGYSKFEFSKKFKKKTGFSASHFLSFLKIEKALEIILKNIREFHHQTIKKLSRNFIK